MDWKDVLKSEGTYAVACPEFGEDEAWVNENFSLDNKPLLVLSYLKKKSYWYKCDGLFELSAVIREHSEPNEKSVEFGYEVGAAKY